MINTALFCVAISFSLTPTKTHTISPQKVTPRLRFLLLFSFYFVVVVVAHILIKTHICWMRAEWWQYTRIMHDTYTISTYSFSFLTLYLFHSLTSSCVQFVFDFFLLYFRLVLYAVCVCVCHTTCYWFFLLLYSVFRPLSNY